MHQDPATTQHLPYKPHFTRQQFKQISRILDKGRLILQAITPQAEQTSGQLHQIFLWLQGLSLLLRVQHFHLKHEVGHFSNLQRIFAHSGITPQMYTIAFFRQSHVVYCRISTNQKLQRFSYIGSTSQTMTQRESSRNRKFKQLKNRKIVQAELSLRWWHKHKCYHQYTPIVLQANIQPQQLEATENTLIQHHQTKLNYPYITSHMKGAFSGFTKAANNKRSGTASLWAKLRRGRLHHSIRSFNNSPLFETRKQAWLTVSHLSSNMRTRFDTVRQLLRSETPASTVYALHKLSSNLPRRDRCHAHKALRTVFKKRQLKPPATTKPIYVQALLHPTFTNNLRQFLRSCLTRNKQHLPPYTYPAQNPYTRSTHLYSNSSTTGEKPTPRGSLTKSHSALVRPYTIESHRTTFITTTLPYRWWIYNHNTVS